MGLCANCIDVRNQGKKFCKFCGGELSSDAIAQISTLEVEEEGSSSILYAQESQNVMEEMLKKQREAEEAKKQEREQKRRAEQERQRELEREAQKELARVNSIKAKMTDVELLQFELQERILEVLLVIASKDQKSIASTLPLGGWILGLSALLNTEDEL